MSWNPVERTIMQANAVKARIEAAVIKAEQDKALAANSETATEAAPFLNRSTIIGSAIAIVGVYLLTRGAKR